MSSLNTSQRNLPFSFGNWAMLNETQEGLLTQTIAHSFAWTTSQGESKRVPWRCWNLCATKFAYDTPSWERDRFKPWSPRSECWCWWVTHGKRKRTMVYRKWNILSSRNTVLASKISFNWTWVHDKPMLFYIKQAYDAASLVQRTVSYVIGSHCAKRW